jgi:shikimate 5-dehydrogenase
MRLILTGFRGTGKTEVGKLLSRLLGLPVYDTDHLIEERCDKPVHEIFESDGEEYFRAVEREIIHSLPGSDCIISTGGGAVLDPLNVEALRRDSVIILLEADEETIEKRIMNTKRPHLTHLPLRDEISQVLEERRIYYNAAADFCVDTSSGSINGTCLEIRRILKEGRSIRPERERAVARIRKSGIEPFEASELEGKILSEGADPLTRIYGIAGDPCTHSKSPSLFNALYPLYHINAYYTWFQDPDFSRILRTAHDLDVRGLSVTIPHKAAALSCVDICDEHADAIGAVNTLVFCSGDISGYNTDWLGIREPLADSAGSRAVVIGAGGAAASAVYALTSLDMDVTVLNRTVENAELLALRFDCGYGPVSSFETVNPDVVVNATPVGMYPGSGSPLDKELLKPGMTVFDLVYTPPETPLIRYARQKGCTIIPGMEMFVRQAVLQFWYFTGVRVPREKVWGLLK